MFWTCQLICNTAFGPIELILKHPTTKNNRIFIKALYGMGLNPQPFSLKAATLTVEPPKWFRNKQSWWKPSKQELEWSQIFGASSHLTSSSGFYWALRNVGFTLLGSLIKLYSGLVRPSFFSSPVEPVELFFRPGLRAGPGTCSSSFQNIVGQSWTFHWMDI